MISYLAAMATRLVLTLLAVLTGLVTQLSPAQARACTGVNTEIGEVSAGSVALRRSAAVALFSPPLQRHGRLSSAALSREFHEPAPVVPAVLQGIDRARE